MTNSLAIRGFFDEATNTVSYLVWDRGTRRGAVIDPVLDFDHRSGKASMKSADVLLDAAEKEGVELDGCWRRTPMPTTSPPRPTSS